MLDLEPDEGSEPVASTTAPLAAVDDPPADAPAPADPPAGKQLKIDGMPVAEEFVVFTGRIRVTRALVEKWKLGKPIQLPVECIIDSRKQKVVRNGGEATGELTQQVVLQVLDVVVDDE